MADPQRWLEGPSSADTKALLRAAPRAVPLSQVTRRRVEQQLMALGPAPGLSVFSRWGGTDKAPVARGGAEATAAGKGALIKLASGSVGGKVIVSAAMVLAVGAGAALLRGRSHESFAPEPHRRTQVDADKSTPAPDVRGDADKGLTSPAPSRVAEETKAGPSRKLSGGVKRVHRSPLPTDPVAGDLRAELELLEAARAQVSSKPSRALALLDDHRRKFPHSQLSSERALLRVEALLGLGRREEAVRLADRLLRSESHGLYEQRLRRLLSPADKKQRRGED